MSEVEGKGLVPELRFPEFSGEWNEERIKNLVSVVTPPLKLRTDQYQLKGKYPIIDQSQSYICGWTNNQSSIVSQGLPLIVFGDHTCVLKIITHHFAQGADGIKILRAKEKIEPRFLYQSLQHSPLVIQDYKRH